LIVDKSNVQYLFPVSVKLYPNLTYYILLKDNLALPNMKENNKANKIGYLPETIFSWNIYSRFMNLGSNPPDRRREILNY